MQNYHFHLSYTERVKAVMIFDVAECRYTFVHLPTSRHIIPLRRGYILSDNFLIICRQGDQTHSRSVRQDR